MDQRHINQVEPSCSFPSFSHTHQVVSVGFHPLHTHRHTMLIDRSLMKAFSLQKAKHVPLEPHMVCPSGLHTRVFSLILLWGKLFAENSRLTSLQRVAARRVVSLSSCYFQQKPYPQKRMGFKWLNHLSWDISLSRYSKMLWNVFLIPPRPNMYVL